MFYYIFRLRHKTGETRLIVYEARSLNEALERISKTPDLEHSATEFLMVCSGFMGHPDFDEQMGT